MYKYLAEDLADDNFEATFASWIIGLKRVLGSDIRKANEKQNPRFFQLWMSACQLEHLNLSNFVICT